MATAAKKPAKKKKKSAKASSRASGGALLEVLRARFLRHPLRHQDLTFDVVEQRLAASPAKLRSLQQMEDTGGEPDVIGRDEHSGEILFCDCAAESPAGRRSVCYDAPALASRKEHKPKHSAVGLAKEMGVELLDEEQYLALQALGEFDLKTSSWLKTSPDVRRRGGAIFGDRRFGRVFVYHNGAESYYAARGFRALLRV